jgi:hypothetical protein
MLLLRTGQTGDAERSDLTMNALAILYVNQHLQELLDEAANDRATRTFRPSLTSQITSALSTLRMAISHRTAFAS